MERKMVKQLKDFKPEEIIYMVEGIFNAVLNKYKIVEQNGNRCSTKILNLYDNITEKELSNSIFAYKTKLGALKEIESIERDRYIYAKKEYDKARKEVIKEEKKII